MCDFFSLAHHGGHPLAHFLGHLCGNLADGRANCAPPRYLRHQLAELASGRQRLVGLINLDRWFDLRLGRLLGWAAPRLDWQGFALDRLRRWHFGLQRCRRFLYAAGVGLRGHARRGLFGRLGRRLQHVHGRMLNAGSARPGSQLAPHSTNTAAQAYGQRPAACRQENHECRLLKPRLQPQLCTSRLHLSLDQRLRDTANCGLAQQQAHGARGPRGSSNEQGWQHKRIRHGSGGAPRKPRNPAPPGRPPLELGRRLFLDGADALAHRLAE